MSKSKKLFIILVAIFVAVYFAFIAIKASYNYFMKCIYPIKYENIVKQASENYNLPQEFIFAVIKAESKFNATSISYAGAVGLMQLTPETFHWLQKKRNIKKPKTEDQLLNPKVNIDYGSYFLKFLFDKYQDKPLVLAAYNAGINIVDKWLKNRDFISDDGTYNIPYKQTKTYIEKVLLYETKYKDLYFSQ